MAYGTQGGGLVEWDELQKAWLFVEAPPTVRGLEVGDRMPQEWSLGGYVETRDAAAIHFDHMTKVDGGDIEDDSGFAYCIHCKDHISSCLCVQVMAFY